MSLSKFLADKKVGFWFSVATVIMLLLCGILFLAVIPGLTEYTTYALKTVKPWFLTFVGVIAIVGAVASGVLLGFKQYKAIGYTEFGVSLVSFLLFIYASYRYIFEWFLDIEVHSIYPSFIVITIFFVVTLVLSIANVFLKQVKDAKEVEEVANEQA